MINLNGVQLKNVKTYTGHEGEPCPFGSIHLKNKKVGTFKLETWSGSYEYDLDEPALTAVKHALTESSVMSELRDGRDGEQPLFDDIIEHFIIVSNELADLERQAKSVTTKYKRSVGVLVGFNYEAGGLNHRGEPMNHFSHNMTGKAVFVWVDGDVAKQSAKYRADTKADLYLIVSANAAVLA